MKSFLALFLATCTLFPLLGCGQVPAATSTPAAETPVTESPAAEVATPKRTAKTGKYLDILADREIRELTFAELEDPYGVKSEYMLDLVTAKEPSDSPRPVVFNLVGSAFVKRDRARLCRTAAAANIADWYINAGFAYVGVDYPLWNKTADYMKLQADFAATGENHGYTLTKYAAEAFHQAKAYLAAHAEEYNLDLSRVVYVGNSAGAITGLFDLSEHPEDASVLIDLCGAYPMNPTLPENFPPIYCIHGTEDTIVNYAWQLDLQKQLDQTAIPHIFVEAKGYDHDISEVLYEHLDEIVAFSLQYLPPAK